MSHFLSEMNGSTNCVYMCECVTNIEKDDRYDENNFQTIRHYDNHFNKVNMPNIIIRISLGNVARGMSNEH